MKACPPLLAATVLLAFLNLSFAASPKGESMPEPTESSTVFPADVRLIDIAAEENIETAAEITAAESASPMTAEDFYQHALEHGGRNEFEEAIANCSEAIRLDPDNLQYRIYRAALNCDTRNLDQVLIDV